MPHRRRVPHLLVGFLGLYLATAWPVAAEPLRLGGKSGFTELLRQLGSRFGLVTGTLVEVVPGLGSTAAIKAASAGGIQLVLAGRALLPNEAASNLSSSLSVCTPFVFATSEPQPGSLDAGAIASIYARAAPTWPGGLPIRIILRQKHESDNATLSELFPDMQRAIQQARLRPAVPVVETDQENASLAVKLPGSLIATTYTQIIAERHDLRLVAINGMSPDMETYESGQYPFGKRLYFYAARRPAPEVSQFLDFLRSPGGTKAMWDLGVGTCPRSD